MMLQFVRFGPANLALHPLLLPDGIGVDSNNQRPGRGDLRPLKKPRSVSTVNADTLTIYRMGRGAPDDANYWLRWTTDVDVARGFIAEDTAERTFWTGNGAPKWTDNTIGLAAPPYPDSAGVRPLGVPQPNATPSLTQQVAGTGDDETRAYVVTWVNDHGEESMPSPAVTITCKPGATIRVTRNASVPTGAYGITSWRIYRTLAGGENDYYYVTERLAAISFHDESGEINTSSPLLSETWEMPPEELKGLKSLWNGMMVGFVGKSLRFSEPFRPYAWPVGYELIIDDDIVALARWRQQLLVLTVNQPYLVTGSNPDAMTVQPLEIKQACVAKRGVVEFGHGVAWPSPDGLVYVGDGGSRILTDKIALREDWQSLTPSTMVAGVHEGDYVCSFVPAGFPRRSMRIDPLNPTGFYFSDAAFVGCYADPIADAFYVLDGTNVKRWDDGEILTVSNRTKVLRLGRPTSFSWCQVVADTFPVALTVWADGLPLLKNHLVMDAAAFRMPGGFLAEQWSVRVSATGPVQAVYFAHSGAELAST